MADNQEAVPGTTPPTKSAHQILNETREGRQALKRLADPLFVTLWTDFLNIVFEWFPHEPNDGSENERAFKAIRHRVLRVGNGQARQLTMMLEDFAILQVRTRTVVKTEVATHGPFALPVGVQMPPKRS